jgi:hypothetical protein
MLRPFIHPYAYSIIILLFTIVTTAIFILLPLLSFCYCYYYKTVATDKLLRPSLFLGAPELTTHMLRLINILWHPLCRINKFWVLLPSKTVVIPYTCGSSKTLPEPSPVAFLTSLTSPTPPPWWIGSSPHLGFEVPKKYSLKLNYIQLLNWCWVIATLFTYLNHLVIFMVKH